jgi:5-methylcytosine-specific restriction endonuclease McrA
MSEPKYHKEKWLREKYVSEGLSTTDMADICGVNSKTIWYWLDKHDIETKSPAEVCRERNKQMYEHRLHHDEEWLYTRYVEESKTISEMAHEAECSLASISRMLHQHPDIEVHDRGPREDTEHPLWYGRHETMWGRNWEQQRAKALELYGHRCGSCGSSESDVRRLNVHHVIPRREFRDGDDFDFEVANKVENLVPLCDRCHKRWEGIPLRPEPPA